MSIYDKYPARNVCPKCEDYAAANVHDLMRHMADHCPVEKAPAQNLEQEMETGEPVFYTWEDEAPIPPEWQMFGQEDEDACFAGHWESEAGGMEVSRWQIQSKLEGLRDELQDIQDELVFLSGLIEKMRK